MVVTAEAALPKALVDSHANRIIYGLVQAMQASQWWSVTRLRRHQERELRNVLNYAKTHSGFYGQRLAAIDPRSFQLSELAEIPVLTRQELRQYREQLRCREIPAAHGALDQMMTSGSTAAPVTVDTTAYVAAVWSALTLRDHIWHRRDASLSNAAMRWRVENSAMAPGGESYESWGAPYDSFYQTGRGYFLNSSSALHDQLDWLQRINPHYLITHPSNLRGLIESGMARPGNLQQIRTVGEAVDVQLRESVRAVLGRSLVDIYSCQEAGYLALQCPVSENYHVAAESVIVEILNEDDRHCTEGESGRLVVTSLSNYALPLIRYELGDFAEVGGNCPCGRGLPVLKAVQGRVRNLLTLADGSRRWPNFGFRAMTRFADIHQFQIVQHSIDRLELKLVVAQTPEADAEAGIRKVLAEHLQFNGEIAISYHDSIARSAGGKYEDFISHIDGQH